MVLAWSNSSCMGFGVVLLFLPLGAVKATGPSARDSDGEGLVVHLMRVRKGGKCRGNPQP